MPDAGVHSASISGVPYGDRREPMEGVWSDVWKIAGCSIVGSAVFFLVTNFAVWSTSRVDPASIPGGAAFMFETGSSPYPFPLVKYSNSVVGLVVCYWRGLTVVDEAPPLGFGGNLFVADLFFNGLLFGAHALLVRAAARRSEPVKVSEAS